MRCRVSNTIKMCKFILAYKYSLNLFLYLLVLLVLWGLGNHKIILNTCLRAACRSIVSISPKMRHPGLCSTDSYNVFQNWCFLSSLFLYFLVVLYLLKCSCLQKKIDKITHSIFHVTNSTVVQTSYCQLKDLYVEKNKTVKWIVWLAKNSWRYTI